MSVLVVGIVAVVSVVLWSLVLHGEVAKRRAVGRSAVAAAIVVVAALAPFLFWLAGDHRPSAEYSKLPSVTSAQRLVGQASQLLLIGLIGSAGLCLLSRQETLNLSGRRLWLSYVAFSVGPVLAMAAGTRPGLRYSLLLAPTAATAVFLCMTRSAERWVTLLRRLLLMFVWASLAIAVVYPAYAFDPRTRATLLLGTAPRLVGVTQSANLLGPVAATALLLVVASSRGWWRVANGVATGLVLVLTDSRMVLVGTVIALLVLSSYRQEGGRRNRLGLAAIAIVLPLLAMLMVESPRQKLAEASGGSLSTEQVASFSGRAAVWETTLEEWQRNPVFGYGPDLWSPEYRKQFGQRFNWVGQAHNQWVQSLGDSGLLGFAGLSFYVAALVATGVRTAGRSRGLSLALVVLLLFRMLSESALRMPGMDVTTLLHLVTFIVLVAFSVQTEGARPPLLGPDAASLGAGWRRDPQAGQSLPGDLRQPDQV